MRPIIPCHSAVQNPAAKYISKMLKPIIKLVPSIIHGTKDLAIKLSKIQLIPNRKFYFITRDIVAYYCTILTDCSWTLPDRVHKRILTVTGTKSVRFAPKYYLNRQVSHQITLNQVFTAACDPWWNTSSARFTVAHDVWLNGWSKWYSILAFLYWNVLISHVNFTWCFIIME